MKIAVRAFVLVLTLSGSAAYTKLTLSSHTQPNLQGNTVHVNMVPSCEPDDPNACGLHKKKSGN